MKHHKKNIIIPIFLPFEGCNNRCIYCNQRLLHPASENITSEEIENKIANYLSTIKRDRGGLNIEVAFYGSTFTNINIEKQKYLLNCIQKFIANKTIDGIRFSTRPDTLDLEKVEIYREKNVTTIEIGAQTFNDNVLGFIKRNHSSSDIKKSLNLLKSNKFKTSLHLMFGLPYSTYQDDINSIEETINLKPDFVRLHPTLVLKDTELERLYKEGIYKPLSMEDAIKILRYALKRFSEAGIRVIRVGLHNDENLLNPSTFVAGPFHPSLRQMVVSQSD